jgi:hypothetical protein
MNMRRLIATLIAGATFAIPAAAQAHYVSPLGWNQAHHAAQMEGWSLPVPGIETSVKTTFCARFTSWHVACNVEGDGTVTTSTYDSCATIDSSYNCVGGEISNDSPSWCMVIVDVYKHRSLGGWVSTRQEGDLSCYGG